MSIPVYCYVLCEFGLRGQKMKRFYFFTIIWNWISISNCWKSFDVLKMKMGFAFILDFVSFCTNDCQKIPAAGFYFLKLRWSDFSAAVKISVTANTFFVKILLCRIFRQLKAAKKIQPDFGEVEALKKYRGLESLGTMVRISGITAVRLGSWWIWGGG